MGAALERSLEPHLGAGERVIAMRPVAPGGTLGAMLAGGLGGQAGAALGSTFGGAAKAAAHVAGETLGHVAANDPSPVVVHEKVNLLVITQMRLILAKTRLGRVTRVLHQGPLADVADIEVLPARVAFGKVHVRFVDGRLLVLDLQSDRKIDDFAAAARQATRLG